MDNSGLFGAIKSPPVEGRASRLRLGLAMSMTVGFNGKLNIAKINL